MSLMSMETLQGFNVPNYPRHELAALAVEWLTRDSGPRSLGADYETTARMPWGEAFHRTFNRSPADFYREFEEYRARQRF